MDLFAAYKRHAEENGEEPLSQKAFGARLTERGFRRDKPDSSRASKKWVWRGMDCPLPPSAPHNSQGFPLIEERTRKKSDFRGAMRNPTHPVFSFPKCRRPLAAPRRLPPSDANGGHFGRRGRSGRVAMTAAALLRELHRAGVKVRLMGASIACRAAHGALTPALRILVREHRAELIALLEEQEPGLEIVVLQNDDGTWPRLERVPAGYRVEWRFRQCPLEGPPTILDLLARWPLGRRRRWAARALQIRELRGC